MNSKTSCPIVLIATSAWLITPVAGFANLVNSPNLISNKQVESKAFEGNGLRFQSPKCQRLGNSDTVNCSVLVTNISDRGELTPFLIARWRASFAGATTGTSRIIDSNGEVYMAERVIIGQQNKDDFIRTTLTQNIPIKVTVSFNKVPQGTNNLSGLMIGYAFSGFTYAPDRFQDAVFRDIPITTSQRARR